MAAILPVQTTGLRCCINLSSHKQAWGTCLHVSISSLLDPDHLPSLIVLLAGDTNNINNDRQHLSIETLEAHKI